MTVLSAQHQALLALLVVHLMMTAAFLFQIPPHPPLQTPAFGMGPFLGAVIVVILLALTSKEGTTAQVFAVLAALMACVSFGPHKWFDPAMPLIWPALVVTQSAVLFLLGSAVMSLRQRYAA